MLPGPPHPRCCTFAGAVNAQLLPLLPLPPAVGIMSRAAPPTSAATAPPSAAAAAAAASGVWVAAATEQATRSLAFYI